MYWCRRFHYMNGCRFFGTLSLIIMVQWKIALNERKLILEAPIFHFHDCGRKSKCFCGPPHGSPENGPMEEEIPFGNHNCSGSMLVFVGV